MTNKKSFWKKVKKAAKGLALATVIFHLGTQLRHSANDFYHNAKPSLQREAFKKEFGFPLRGWSSDIEDDPKNISVCAEILNREDVERPFTLDTLRIRSDSYLRKSLLDQIHASPFFNEPSGYYFNDIVVVKDVDRNTLHHEIKHAKTFDIIKENKDFLNKWKDLAKDKNGNSLYLNVGEQVCYWVNGLENIISKDKLDASANEKLGFVRSYGRNNVFEDIATICEEAESNESKFARWLFDGDQRNEIIAKKIALAEEYHLIPAGFSEFVKLKQTEQGCYDDHCINWNNALEYIKESDGLLEKYPNSVYKGELHSKRAFLMSAGNSNSFVVNKLDSETADYFLLQAQTEFERKQKEDFKNNGERFSIGEVLREYNLALQSSFKSVWYPCALGHLRDLHKRVLRNENVGEVYEKAEREYWRRFENGDVRLSREGVNDFLKENGVIK